MRYIDDKKQLEEITDPNGLKILLPLEAISIKGSRTIYCPHCGEVIWEIPRNKYSICRCHACKNEFYLYPCNTAVGGTSL